MVKFPKVEKKVVVLGHCARCGPETRASVLAKNTEATEYQGVYFTKEDRIVECGGCGVVYHQQMRSNSDANYQDDEGEWHVDERVENWPTPERRKKPNWFEKLWTVDKALYQTVSETYAAYNQELSILTAIGVRTSFDRATEILKINPNLTFNNKVEALVNGGFIGRTEGDHINTLIHAGNAAAHRGWLPDPTELDIAFDILEPFLHRHFIARAKMDDLKLKVPPRPPRKKT